MPRYYFDIREGADFIPDDEGEEFSDAVTAEQKAAEVVATIGRDRLPEGGDRSVSIEVRNQHNEGVATVMVTMTRRQA